MMAEEWKWNVEQWRIQDLKKGGAPVVLGRIQLAEKSVGEKEWKYPAECTVKGWK